MMLLESGLRAADSFPAGLKVLVVDDDPTWLKILEKMLKKCSYQVTTCGLAVEALRLLRERKDGFDIVISDVNMPDMDGFKLLEHVGLQMDLPVIMMSVDGETSRVMKGVQHGACDYLLKPIRMKELKNIWQHVLRKRMRDVRDVETHDNLDDDDLHLFRYTADVSDSGNFLTSSSQTFYKKRKGLDKNGSAKRRRVVWSVDLHQKFVKAVNQIGFDKVGPKKILDLMNVPRLTRENVASHLQKYRLYLGRLEKENDMKSQNATVNSASPDYNDAKPHKTSIEPGYLFTSDISGVDKAKCSPKIGHDISTGSRKPKNSVASLDSPQLEFKPHQQQLLEMSNCNQLENCFCNSKLLIEEPIESIFNSKSFPANNDLFGLNNNTSFHIDQNALPGFENDEFGGLYSFQNDNFGTGFDNSLPDLSNEALSFWLYGQPRFNNEYFSDYMEYAVVDQGLFIS